MKEYIVDDRAFDLIEKIQAMTDAEFEEYIASIKEKDEY